MAKKTRETLDFSVSGDPLQSYMDAKYASQNNGIWDIASDAVSGLASGIMANKESMRLEEEDNKKILEAHEDQFTQNIEKINDQLGGLGEEYMSVATNEAKVMQEEYMEAVRAGDKEAQSRIKMKLQGLATASGSLKESLNIAAELKNDGLLSKGRTEEEIKIASICTNPANGVFQDGAYGFKDPETGKIYTQEDLDNSLGQIDEVASKAYLDYEMGQNESGMNYVNGTGPDFDFNRIKTSIGDNFIKEDNIMSIMHDDFRKSGESNTFKNDLSGYLEQMPDYYKTFNIDVDGDGIPGNSEEDKAALVKAITDKTDTNYDFKMSKNIVADYLARQSEEKFYGSHPTGKSATERKAMRPLPGENQKTFLARGGILGELAKEGTVYNEETMTFENIAYDSDVAFQKWKNSKK
tara:strand:- start:411 stop:1640 length:1230 start_codon:yes stop_codon:yes gene_type:complete